MSKLYVISASGLIKKFEATNKDCKENFINVVHSRKVSDLSTDVL